MALFGGKKKKSTEQPVKNTQKKVVKPAKAKKATGTPKTPELSHVLLRPHVTEKAAHLTAKNVYTFDIAPSATKKDVAAAVTAVYKVKPVKIAVVKTPGRKVRLRTRRGFGKRSDSKKAYVYLKEGDRIEFSS